MGYKLPNLGSIDPNGELLSNNFAAFDTETTGLDFSEDPLKQPYIVEVGVYPFAGNGETIPGAYSELVKPEVPIPISATKIHGIRESTVSNSKSFAEIYPKLMNYLVGKIPIIYNLPYDWKVCKFAARRIGQRWFGFFGVDPLVLARAYFANVPGGYAQDNLTRHLGIHDGDADHRAFEDARRAGVLFFKKIIPELRNAISVKDFWELQCRMALQHEQRMLIIRRGKPTSTPWHDLLGVKP